MKKTTRANTKKLIPYYHVAKDALMNWNGLSEEEATKMIFELSFDEIEGQVYAKSSMDYAIEGIKNSLNLKNEEAEELSKFIYAGTPTRVFDDLKYEIEKQKSNNKGKYDKGKYNELIMDTLFAVHDGWVKDNVKKFDSRDKKHQHMPAELIGWEEAKSDLLFVKPIFELAGIEVNDKELKQIYDNRVQVFLNSHGIKTSQDLSKSITQGEEFYPALKDYGEILTRLKNFDYVNEKIVPEIEEKGIGKIENLVNKDNNIEDERTEEEEISKLKKEILVDIEIRENLYNEIIEIRSEKTR